MKSYSDKLKDPRWQRKRLEIMQRDNFQCQYCFSKDESLTVHHKYYFNDSNPWDYPDETLITLCEFHHSHFHNVFMKKWDENINKNNGHKEFHPNEYFNKHFYGINATDAYLFEHWVENLMFCYKSKGFKMAMDAIYPLTKKDNIYEETED